MVRLRGLTVNHIPLGEGVAVWCAACKRREVMDRDALIRVLGGERAELDKLDRLRCKDCGLPFEDVWVTWPGAFSTGARSSE